jgi:hypothetical protein
MATDTHTMGTGAERLSAADRGRLRSAAELLHGSSDERVRAAALKLAALEDADENRGVVDDDGLDAVFAKGGGPHGSIARLSDELLRLSKAESESGPGGAAVLADARCQLEEEYLAQVSPSAAYARQEGIRHEAMRKAGRNYL